MRPGSTSQVELGRKAFETKREVIRPLFSNRQASQAGE
jgi:hypothetical protein